MGVISAAGYNLTKNMNIQLENTTNYNAKVEREKTE